MSTSDTITTSSLEVEQKFTLTLDDDNRNENNDAIARMENRLQQLGLEPKGSFTLIDWYFDVEPDWPLTTRDCWLRYRQVIRPDGKTIDPNGVGQWQLKLGQRSSPDQSPTTSSSSSSSTVYEEIEGDAAVETAVTLLVKYGASNPQQQQQQHHAVTAEQHEHLWQGSAFSSTTLHDIPQLPAPSYGLVPFARIESKRSSWIVPSTPTTSDESSSSSSLSWASLVGLSVDLDVTTYGYAVGEVETVVHHESEVDAARHRIQQFLTRLLERHQPNGNTTTTVGKLEYYLRKYRPEHYQACLQSGSLVVTNRTSDNSGSSS